jgi:glutamate synthase (NADPH/NADH) large chain
VVVRPPASATFAAEENIIIGNVALYGATSGVGYFRGVAAERFAVRNSGALAVVEGVGDHGCEYMTGGRVVILGPTGRNFAAGMSGGVAYIFDPNDQLLANINLELVDLEAMDQPADVEELKELISNHTNLTGSVVGQGILDDWEGSLKSFKKVIPILYREILNRKLEEAVTT